MKKFIIYWVITYFLGSFFYTIFFIETYKNTTFTHDFGIFPYILLVSMIIGLPWLIFLMLFYKKKGILTWNICALAFIVIELYFFYFIYDIYMFFICYHIIKFLGLNLIIRE